MNHKRVRRLLREDNLLCPRKRKFVVTTDSHHGPQNLPESGGKDDSDGHRPTIGCRHHLHPAARGICFLGSDSRRLFAARDWLGAGSHNGGRVDAEALRIALANRTIRPGLVHDSDRGSQYAGNDYTDLLKDRGINVSMSRKGNPWDNAACESFMKTLKYKEVFRNDYRNLVEARHFQIR